MQTRTFGGGVVKAALRSSLYSSRPLMLASRAAAVVVVVPEILSPFAYILSRAAEIYLC